MTRFTGINGDPFKDFDKLWVGFDDQFGRMSKLHNDLSKTSQNYPPYNIKKTSETTYVVEIAVAGFRQEDISIETADGTLTVTGNVGDKQEETFLFKGISNRAFTRSFVLAEHIEVRDADMLNGMLSISLEYVMPEHKKPKKIEIRNADQPQMLTE